MAYKFLARHLLLPINLMANKFVIMLINFDTELIGVIICIRQWKLEKALHFGETCNIYRVYPTNGELLYVTNLHQISTYKYQWFFVSATVGAQDIPM